MSADSLQEQPGIEGLGTPREIRESRPALYPEHEALDRQASQHPEILADPGPDDGNGAPGRRSGLAGARDTIAYGVQWLMLSVWGAGEQSRRADPIEKFKRRYGRSQRDY